MKKTVSAMEARRKFGELLEDAYRGDAIVIERAGKTMGVLVSPDQFRIMEQNRERLFKIFEETWARTKGISAEEADRIALAAGRDARGKRAAARRSG
jgi:prevent-host-death family protein